MFRFVASFLILLSLFSAALAMSGSGARAMAHAANGQSADMAGHCDGAGQPSDNQKAEMKLACASACAVLCPVPVAVRAPQPAAVMAAPIALQRMLAGIRPESETPPPRATPEI